MSELPGNYEKGELVIDTAMDLETNVSQRLLGRELTVAKARRRPASAAS